VILENLLSKQINLNGVKKELKKNEYLSLVQGYQPFEGWQLRNGGWGHPPGIWDVPVYY